MEIELVTVTFFSVWVCVCVCWGGLRYVRQLFTVLHTVLGSDKLLGLISVRLTQAHR